MREDPQGRAGLLVLTPLWIERAALGRSSRGVLVLHTGMGAGRSREAALRAARIPAGAVAVAGFCGAVAEGLRPGDVVVAAEVRGPAGVTACEAAPVVAALTAAGVRNVHAGPVVSAGHVVRGAERGALAATGALAADMESGWLAPAAAGRPFAVVRVVLDTPSREFHRPLATVGGVFAAWRALRHVPPGLRLWAQSRE